MDDKILVNILVVEISHVKSSQEKIIDVKREVEKIQTGNLGLVICFRDEDIIAVINYKGIQGHKISLVKL